MMYTVLIYLFSCVLLFQTTLAEDHQGLEECQKSTGIHVTPDMMQKLQSANAGGTFDLNTIPEEVLCLPKCVLEKRDIIDKSGKISTKNMKASNIMKHIPKQEVFSKCVEKIDKIENCNDMKKIIQCRIEAQ